MDPRNREDIEAANGEFESESPDGNKVPLKTFGMFQLGITDENGTNLAVNKPLKFSLDASMFNVPLDKDGNPELSVWNYDTNNGTWVEMAKMRRETSINGRRKLLGPGNSVVDYHPKDIPMIDQYNAKTDRRIVGYTNCDHSVPIYEYVTTKTPKTGACYVSVSVYKDLSLKEAYNDGDIEIKTYVQDPRTQSYIGAMTTKVLKNGHACIPIFCDNTVYINVVRNGKERFYSGAHYMPNPYYIQSTKDNEVKFTSRDFGNAIDQSLSIYKPNTMFLGPVFQLQDKFRCSQISALDNSFQFKFAPFTKAPMHNFVAGSGVYDQKISWYPVSPASTTFRSCFMKVHFKIQNSYDLRLIAKSHLNDLTGEEFGSYEVGPLPDPQTNDLSVRAACFEFRCPGLVNDGAKKIIDMSTAVNNVRRGLNVASIQHPTRGAVGFTFIAEVGNNYGPKYGVFIMDKPSKESLQYCSSGVDFGPKFDGLLNPTKNAAVSFDCT